MFVTEIHPEQAITLYHRETRVVLGQIVNRERVPMRIGLDIADDIFIDQPRAKGRRRARAGVPRPGEQQADPRRLLPVPPVTSAELRGRPGRQPMVCRCLDEDVTFDQDDPDRCGTCGLIRHEPADELQPTEVPV